MFFIGIVSEEKNEKHIKDILKQKIENENVVFINEKNIENIKNIKFKIIVLNKGIDNKNIKNILLNAEYLILNSDINVKLVENLNLKVITYGFNSKATVTASSITGNLSLTSCFLLPGKIAMIGLLFKLFSFTNVETSNATSLYCSTESIKGLPTYSTV